MLVDNTAAAVVDLPPRRHPRMLVRLVAVEVQQFLLAWAEEGFIPANARAFRLTIRQRFVSSI